MFSCSTVLRRSSFCCTLRKSGSILMMKKMMMAEVTSSSGSMVMASAGAVLTIRIRLPIISNGARVPMRNVVWVSCLRAVTSLLRRTSSWPVFCRSKFPKE